MTHRAVARRPVLSVESGQRPAARAVSRANHRLGWPHYVSRTRLADSAPASELVPSLSGPTGPRQHSFAPPIPALHVHEYPRSLRCCLTVQPALPAQSTPSSPHPRPATTAPPRLSPPSPSSPSQRYCANVKRFRPLVLLPLLSLGRRVRQPSRRWAGGVHVLYVYQYSHAYSCVHVPSYYGCMDTILLRTRSTSRTS